MNEKDLILEILEELRITEEALVVMAEGASPNKIGAIDGKEGKRFIYRYPVVQLSQKLSERLLNINLEWKIY